MFKTEAVTLLACNVTDAYVDKGAILSLTWNVDSVVGKFKIEMATLTATCTVVDTCVDKSAVPTPL